MGTAPPRVRPWLATLGFLALLAAFAVVSMASGTVEVSVPEVLAVVGHRGLHLPIAEPEDPVVWSIVWQLRFPRVALAALVGAGLALAGVASQALVRNVLADPFVLGVSSGATLATVAAAAWGFALPGVLGEGVVAVAGAIGTLALVLAFAARNRGASALRLVLAGIALGHLFASLTTYVVVRELRGGAGGVQALLSGNLNGAKLVELWLPAILVALAGALLACDARRLDALLVGEETAASLGVHTGRLRLRLVLITGTLVGVLVAQAGTIGFVGLVVPHMARALVGTDHRRLVPVAAAGGAAFLVVCDYLAATVALPQTLPVGFVAGAIGGPMFLAMIRRGRVGRRA
ncbi:MAG: FecCD family ABC transporter permease [Sporichthyaceae bacterium]